MSTLRWRVWLGYRIANWRHRGCAVRGESVYVTSRREARAIVRESIGPRAPRVACPDGEYVYATREAMDRDDTGVLADAVICRVDDAP